MMSPNIYMLTGITGQLGRAFVRSLSLSPNNYIIGLCRPESLERANRLFSKDKNVIIVAADKGEKGLFKALLSLYRPDTIGHLAAKSSVFESNNNPLDYFSTNVEYTLEILEAIRGVYSNNYRPKFFNMSSVEIFGNSNGLLLESRNESCPVAPSNNYGASKASAHIYVDIYRAVHGIYANNIISANFISEFQSPNFVIGKVLDFLFNYSGQKLKLGNINSIRDWSYVDDIVSGILTSLGPDIPNNYCLSSGNVLSVDEVVGLLFNKCGIKDYKNYIEIESKFFRIGDTSFTNLDCSRLRSLNWAPEYDISKLLDKVIANKRHKQCSPL